MKKTIIISTVIYFLCHPLLALERIVVLLGPPGSGKGTQSLLLKEALNWPVLKAEVFLGSKNITDHTRETYVHHIKSNEQCKNFFKTGLMITGLKEYGADNIILESWPKLGKSIDVFADIIDREKIIVIELISNDQVSLERVCSRKQCRNCGISYGRTKPERVNNICDQCCHEMIIRRHDNSCDFPLRLSKYRAKQPGFREAFKRNNIEIHAVDADRPALDIHHEIMKLLEEKFDLYL